MKRGENQQPFASPEEACEYLKHHGIKGMKWGVRKEEDLAGRMSVPPKPPISKAGKIGEIDLSDKADEYHRLAGGIAQRAGVNSHLAAAKYGPPGMQAQIERQHQVDREKLKKAALIAGVGIGAAAAGFAVYKLNQSGAFENLPGMDLKKEFALLGTNQKAYGSAVDGLDLNWEHGVNLPKGSIIRRLSSVAETVPRPEGFYAAHLDSDVESYKAILPTFWQQWGVGSAKAGGFLNHYQANDAIRAPSGKESFGLFKDLLGTNDSFKELATMWLPKGASGSTERELKQLFVDHSAQWADKTDPLTQEWFKEVQKRGYNALIDFNDAGKLGKTPIRVLDGNMFNIVKNEPQSLNDFYTAAKKWSPELIHIYLLQNGEYVLVHIDDSVEVIRLGRDAIGMMPDR